ncbi:NAD(P)-binding protein [Basidiobolus meristosporus CBS 931.73]|uniref:NAD(P)-binding protein n=1 Tax=Basidiobolus meristosporus CBS 931.73 TaxID=1314790 RepID=A0A1Y1Z3B0_9FUNG|nr:NAD(P)-binding protein [Basidiobolus meristosporus CBS 931.73]|eukprot:ORY04437.1 NAD(P)-binding protein [Basidiobolus meristosporus CBS 931.73]
MSSLPPVIVVTGASRGIGRAVTLEALEQGAFVVSVARTEHLLRTIEAETTFPANYSYIVADLALEKDLERVVSHTIAKHGRIDSIILNAGVIDPIKSLADIKEAEWRSLFELNFFSVVSLVQKALPELRKSRGNCVMVSSGAAMIAFPGWAAYCCSKAALNMFSYCLAIEEPEVRCTAIHPGAVDTDFQRLIRETGLIVPVGSKHMSRNDYNGFVSMKHNNILVKPDEVGFVLAKLARDGVPDQFHGKFFSWDDAELEYFRKI